MAVPAGATGGAGLGLGLDPITAGIGAATQIAGTIAQISDMSKRRDFDFALGRLSLAEKTALERELGRANTQAQKLAILTQAVSSIRSAEVTQKLVNKGMAEADERKKERMMIYLIVGGGLALILTVVLIKKL
jgi:hypothetical protein